MHDPFIGLRTALYTVALLLMGIVGGSILRIVPTLEHTLDSLNDALTEVHAIEVNTTRLEAEATGLLNASRQVVLSERRATDAQIKQIASIAEQTGALLKHADAAVTDLDLAAKQTLAGAAVDEADVSALLRQTTTSLRDVGDNANLLLENATSAIDASQTHEALANVVTATQNLATTTADASASMATVRHGVEVEVAQLTAPPRKIKWLSEEVVRMVGKFFGY